MNPFKRASSAASLHADCAKLRRRLTDLEAQRDTLQQTISTSTDAVHQALMSEAAESVVVKAEEVLTSAERRLTAVTATITAIERELAAKEQEIVATARRKAAEEAVAAMKADDATVVELMLQLADIAGKLLPIATKHARGNWDAREVEAIAKMASEELPRLAARVSATTDFECSRLLSGDVAPKTAVPVVVAAPKPVVPTRLMFTLGDIRWNGGGSHLHQFVQMPVALAERAMEFDYAPPADDKRCKELHCMTGQLAPPMIPAPAHFVNIEAPDLTKRVPIFGNDAAIKRIQVVHGG